jgi:hypothetical protein
MSAAAIQVLGLSAILSSDHPDGDAVPETRSFGKTDASSAPNRNPDQTELGFDR